MSEITDQRPENHKTEYQKWENFCEFARSSTF